MEPRESPVPPKHVQPGPADFASRRLASATWDFAARKRMTWWTILAWPGSIRADVTNPSPASLGSSRKQR